ncbi:hypothetical protein [Thiohalophilus sp.]|uniref:hypothetical protein n=1 Tax=Thiohalophilus sp. TaxID=3028392 RepID=UPI002ACE6CE1|nr:hypothetical protein [Thiohalophilus sp.]MDZ7802388.1 hypothetical protein [Thiohalophilus sp.]
MMATESKVKSEKAKPDTKKSSKRTYPYKKAHREILDFTLTEQTTEMLIEQILMLDKARIRAMNDLHNFVLDRIVDRVIEPGNAELDPSMQQTSLTIYSPDGKYKFSCNQQISRQFDDRAQQATALIQSFINEHRNVEDDKEVAFLMNMLEAMLFGASRKKQFRWTPELKKFMEMETDELPDERLVKARDILREAFHTHRSKWYYGCGSVGRSERMNM